MPHITRKPSSRRLTPAIHFYRSGGACSSRTLNIGHAKTLRGGGVLERLANGNGSSEWGERHVVRKASSKASLKVNMRTESCQETAHTRCRAVATRQKIGKFFRSSKSWTLVWGKAQGLQHERHSVWKPYSCRFTASKAFGRCMQTWSARPKPSGGSFSGFRTFFSGRVCRRNWCGPTDWSCLACDPAFGSPAHVDSMLQPSFCWVHAKVARSSTGFRTQLSVLNIFSK